MPPALTPQKSPQSVQDPASLCSRTGLYQQRKCLLHIRVFHVLIPSPAKLKAKIPPKPPPNFQEFASPAINRPLIGGCNRIQFISRSDGLTFIITRGSACHELWAIHSLVEINCVTSAQHCVLHTRHVDGPQLLTSIAGDQLPTAWVQGLLQGATQLTGLERNCRVYESFLDLPWLMGLVPI